MSNNERITSAEVEIIINSIRTDTAFNGYKFRSERALLREAARSSFSIGALDIPGINCIKKAGIRNLGQLIVMSDAKIYGIRGIGEKKAEEIIAALDKIRYPLCQAVVEGKLSKDNTGGKTIRGEAPSVFHIIHMLSNKNQRDVLEARFTGWTLEEAGEVLGITRERVRQIQNAGLSNAHKLLKVQYNRTEFKEDGYKSFFEKYKTDKDFWDFAEEKDTQPYFYLDTLYSKGSEELEKALTDADVKEELKRVVEKYLEKDNFFIDGVKVRRSRKAVETYLLKKCIKPTAVSDFTAMYNQFIAEQGLENELDFASDACERSIAARIANSRDVLWLGSNTFRFYDFSGKDFTGLVEGLSLHNYKDTEVSARIFTRDFPDLMKEYGICDENELHYILKQVIDKTKYPDMSFGRTPMIRFGEFDRELNVFMMMVKMAPVSRNELVAAIAEKYGVNEPTVVSNWLGGVSQYFHKGMYVFDAKDYPFLYKTQAA